MAPGKQAIQRGAIMILYYAYAERLIDGGVIPVGFGV
jgi:hypothetical protein